MHTFTLPQHLALQLEPSRMVPMHASAMHADPAP